MPNGCPEFVRNQVSIIAQQVIQNMRDSGYLNTCRLPASVSLQEVNDDATSHGLYNNFVKQILCQVAAFGGVGNLLSGGLGSSDFLRTLDPRSLYGKFSLNPIVNCLKAELQVIPDIRLISKIRSISTRMGIACLLKSRSLLIGLPGNHWDTFTRRA